MRMFSTVFYSLAMACSALGQTYTIKTLAGGGWPDRVPALSVGLANTVESFASDRTGNLYFSIAGFVLRLDSAGNLARVAGDGVCRYDGDNGPAATAGICRPMMGLAIDGAGNLYIADSESHVVRKVSNGIITTFAGNGSQGQTGDNGPATSAKLGGPGGLALDAAGNLYIADGSVVRKVSNGIITTVAGGGPASDIAVDSAGSLYILDDGSNVIRKVSNGTITTLAGSYSGGTDRDNIPATSATLSPSGLAVDSSGNAYISEASRGRIRKVSNGIITTIAGTGVRGHSGDGGPATSAQLIPGAIAVGANGDIYVADLVSNGPGTWVRKISNGIITTVAGNGVNETSDGYIDIFGADDNGPVANSFLDNPVGVAIDASGRIYVADISFSVVREISNGTIRTVAGNWSHSDLIDNIPATQASLYAPSDVAVDADENIFITDYEHGSVRKVSNGMITTVAGGGTTPGDNVAATSVELRGPTGIAADSKGSVYFTEGSAARLRRVSGGIISTIAGNGTEGYGGDNGAAVNAQLKYPQGVAVDTSGSIYVADAGNSRIRKISNGIITTIAGNGTAGYGGDNGPAVSAQLNYPDGVAVDRSGNVFIADSARIRRISNGIITTIAGNGTHGYGGDGGPALSAKLNGPVGIAVDAAGNIYFADEGNHRVRVLVPSGSSTCAYSLDSQTLGAAASGGTVTVKVTTGSGCAWTAASSASWVTATTGTSGSGNGTVTFTAAANTSSSVRTGVLTVAGQNIYLNQAAAGQAASSLVSLTSGAIVNAASGATTIAPGSFISIFGQNLSDVTDTWGSAITDGLTLPTALRGVRVRINGKDCYVYFVSPGQINVLTPPDTATGPVLVEVVTTHGTAAAMVQMSQASPGWFTYAAQGKTYVAALTIPDNLLAAPVGAVPGAASRPALAGEYVQLYANGLGATNPPYPAGQVLTTAYPVADRSKMKVTVGGEVAPVAFAGMVSPGLYQVNIRVPDDVASGTLPVVLSVDGQASQTNAVVAFTFVAVAPPTLKVAKTHTGSFNQGQTEATYTVLVSNVGANPTSGPVTVTENLPTGLSLTAMSGAGWNCAANSCTRNDALSAASSYPALAVTVNVAANAPPQVTNQVSVSGGGSATASASDLTTIDAPGSTPGISVAVMQSPVPGSVLEGSTVTFTWSAGVGVSAYRIDVGSIPGSSEYFLGTFGNATSQVVTNLPVNGSAVCVTLSSMTAGVWQTNRYTYIASGGASGESSYLISTIAGGAQLATAVPGTAVGAPEPRSIATDAAGNVYFSGRMNAVFKLSTGGVLTRVAGSGVAGSWGDGGAATSAAFWGPAGVAVDAAGNLYVADTYNNRIRKVSASTGVITTVAGSGARGDFSGDGGPATGATIDGPKGVAVDSAGNLYIADYGQDRIRKVSASSGLITTVAGNGQRGYSGDGGSATLAAVSGPTGLAVDAAGNLYFSDYTQRVRKVTASSGVITTVAGTGTAGFSGDGGAATKAQLYYPEGITVDAAGNLYIADADNYRVRKVTASSGVITTVAGGGAGIYEGDGGAATLAALNWPEAVAVDASGNLYIADSRNNRIRKVSAGGIISTVAGGGGVGDGSLAVLAPISRTSGVARDSSGNLYVSDGSEHRVRKIDARGVITTVAGTGTLDFSGDGRAASSAALNEPSGLAVDAAGNLYIADTNNNRIRKITAATGVITTVAGNGSGGFSGDGGPATNAALWVPSGTALDAVGNLYVADRGNSRVRKITAATGVITTVAGNGTYGSSGDDGAATGATLGMPWGVAVDTAGNLYISDNGYSRIRKVTASNGVITTLAGNGTNGFSGDGAAAADAVLFYPSGVAVDTAGNLYFADEFNGRIRRVAASGTITTVAGNGLWSYSGDGGAATIAAFDAVSAVTVDSAGRVYVADEQNGAVRLLTPIGTSAVLTVNVMHAGPLTAGQSGSYSVTVTNAGSAGDTSGAVTVTEALPAGLSLVSMSGSGWSCSADSCTRSDSLKGGSSYPAITVLVNTSASAPEQVTNQVSVSGGGAAITGTQDLTLITGVPRH